MARRQTAPHWPSQKMHGISRAPPAHSAQSGWYSPADQLEPQVWQRNAEDMFTRVWIGYLKIEAPSQSTLSAYIGRSNSLLTNRSNTPPIYNTRL